MELNLEEKQLLRSIADIVLQNPSDAKLVWRYLMASESQFSSHLNGIGHIVDEYNDSDDLAQYHENVRSEIANIKDLDVKQVFTNALMSI